MGKIMKITDFSDPGLDVYARLTENQLLNRADPANALFIAESPLVIGRALDAGCVPVSFLTEEKYLQGKAQPLLDRCGEIPVWRRSQSWRWSWAPRGTAWLAAPSPAATTR